MGAGGIASQSPTRSRLALPKTGAAALLVAATCGGWLLATEPHDYPALHTILDTAIFIQALILAFFLTDLSERRDQPLSAWLGISFAVVALLAVVHVVVTIDWFGAMEPIRAAVSRWRPATWPPAVHVLPIGVALAISPWCRRGRPQHLFALGLLLFGAMLLVLFSRLPSYTEPGWFGVTRPTLILVPILWAAVAVACWRSRDEDRLLGPLAVMSAVLILANLAMLYSRAPHDAPAMVAHLGRIAGFLTLLISQMQLASDDLVARQAAEQELATLNRELEYRVRDRTAQLEESGRQLQVEAAVRMAAEDRFRAVVESAPSGMVMIDSAGRINLVNREILRLFGYSREEMLGMPIEQLVPRRLRQSHTGFRAQFFREPQARNMGAGRELFGVRKDGVEFPVEIGLNPIESPDGIFVLASVLDITARKTTELELLRTNERLHRAQARFEAVVESASSGMVMIDQAGRITLVNREAERLFDYSREELLGMSVEQLVPQRMRADHAGYRHQFLKEPQARTMGVGRDLFGVRRDGLEFPVEIGLNPIETPEGIFVLASVVDISERKAAEAALLKTNEELQRAQARFEVVVESAPSGMVMVDGRGRINLVNREIERLFGYTRAQLLGRTIEDLIPVRLRRGHLGFRDSFLRDPQTRAMGVGRDLFGLRHDGVEFPVEIGLNPIETMDGTFVLASVVDISARKEAESELRRSNEELERFAYVASHDLQEPLRMVGSYVQLLAKRYRGKLDADADDFIGFAVDGAVRMQHLIEDLLAFSRAGARGGLLATVDANLVLEQARKNLGLAIAEAAATITASSLPMVLADAVQLEQVFQNLIGNALKFRGVAPSIVEIAAVPLDGRWQFSIHDNGIGIEPQYFDRVFALFQRLHTREQYSGTGIGLAISRKIIERHGGRIWVESEPGRGTTFYFTLQAGTGASS